MKKENNLFMIVILAIVLLLDIVAWMTILKFVENVLWSVLSLVGVSLSVAIFLGVLIITINSDE